jgi:hypothetical protein
LKEKDREGKQINRFVLFHIRITGNRRPFKLNFPVYTCQEILLTNFRCPELINHSSVSDNSISICNINIRTQTSSHNWTQNLKEKDREGKQINRFI